ncbi:MAG: hypothetical protein U1G05_19455 [Kiritimatiellia bacterium]
MTDDQGRKLPVWHTHARLLTAARSFVAVQVHAPEEELKDELRLLNPPPQRPRVPARVGGEMQSLPKIPRAQYPWGLMKLEGKA